MKRLPMIFMTSAAIAASACAPMRTPENIENAGEAEAYQAQYRDTAHAEREARNKRSIDLNLARCAAKADPSSRHAVGLDPLAGEPELLSRGDLLDVVVGDDEVFSGAFEVSRDGALRLPHLEPVRAHGRPVEDVEENLRRALVAGGFYGYSPRVSVRVLDFASARVHVSGAVFEPGPQVVGSIAGDDRDLARQAASGASTEARNLSAALRRAGGIRPDADLSRVRVTRSGKTRELDLSASLRGVGFDDLMLLAGDQVEVPSRGCFQDDLMAPNTVTPPGVKIFMSNLTKPADSNALSAIGRDSREMPWGTRFIQAVVGMNCVGGTQLTNADRYAVLFSRNPITGRSVVIERRIEDLLRRADRDDLDPFLLPGDAVACYDSTVTNIVEIAKSFATVIGTGLLLAL